MSRPMAASERVLRAALALTDAAPLHVAIIMDGNGRWAKQRGLPRALGHRAGVDGAEAHRRGGAEAWASSG